MLHEMSWSIFFIISDNHYTSCGNVCILIPGILIPFECVLDLGWMYGLA